MTTVPERNLRGRMQALRALARLRKEYRRSPRAFSLTVFSAAMSLTATIVLISLMFIAPELISGTR